MDYAFTAGHVPAERVRAAFRTLGFVVVRSALEPQEVTRVRSELDCAFASAPLRDLPTLYASELLKREPVWACLFNERVVGALKAALGPELCYQNDLDVQRNSYGQGGLQPHKGWHMDAGSETYNDYLKSREYRFAKCGLFLQDADNGWGGGIMVKPKSHRRFFEPNPVKRGYFRVRRASSVIATRLGVDLDALRVPTRAGDLCFFDSRLLHSSVLPSRENIARIGYDRKSDLNAFWPDVPAAQTKYVIYWDACNAAMVQDFLRNSVRRSELEPSDFREEPRRLAVYSRILALGYPDDYPAEFVAAASRSGVAVATLRAEETTFYKRKLQSMQLIHP